MTAAAKPNHKPLPKLMTLQEVADALGVSTSTVRRLIKPDPATGKPQLPSIAIGTTPKVAHHDVWVYLQQQRQKSLNGTAKLERSTDRVIESVHLPAVANKAPVAYDDPQEGDSVHVGEESDES